MWSTFLSVQPQTFIPILLSTDDESMTMKIGNKKLSAPKTLILNNKEVQQARPKH